MVPSVTQGAGVDSAPTRFSPLPLIGPTGISTSHGMNAQYITTLLHQLIDSPADVEPPQISIMLSHTKKDDRDASRMDHADQRPHHVADRVAFGNDEAVHPHPVVTQLALS